ncbi:MAG: DNA methyltransferase [Bacteroidales bacterium]
MDGKSLTPEQEKINALQQVLPEAFSEGKLDWEKLKATLGENINFSNERYVLNWAGKSDAFKVLQTPTTKTLIPAKDESINFDETQNIFIEGENLEVLKVLQKSYFGKVKMIYIDPPYNTGNDSFIYPDKFSETKEEYQKRVGDKDEDGYMTKDGMFKKNSKENGQYHSNWLNMMMPRLYLAKNLLKQDGVIFVSIGEDEVHNLRQLLNEVFGEENFIMQCSRVMKSGGAKGKFYTPSVDYILVYAKAIYEAENFRATFTEEQINRFYTKKELQGERKGETYGEERLYKASLDARPNQRYYIKCPDGSFVIPPGVNFPNIVNEGEKVKPTSEDGVWKWIFERYSDELNKGNIVFKETTTSALIQPDGKQSKWNIYNKLWLEEQQEKGVVPSNFISNFENRQSSAELKQLDIPFDFAKPSALVSYLIQISSSRNNDLILDFFAGSGTTAHAVMDLNKEDGGNRKYICVQLPELCEEKSEAYKAGYKTIADISKERIRRAGKRIDDEIKTEIKKIEAEIKKLQGEIPTEETKTEIDNLKAQIEQLKAQDLGFKVLKLEDSNFKQWQQIEAKDAKATRAELAEALSEQMKLFIDPIAESATIENMVYELLLKSGKDLNSKISLPNPSQGGAFYNVNDGELVLLLEKATQDIINDAIALKPKKVIALDKLFKGNDQLKTNTVLQMKDAGVEFKTI